MAEQWYYASQGQRLGPIADTQLRELVATRTLSPTDLVWKPGLATWVPADSIPGLLTYPAHATLRPAASALPSLPSSQYPAVANANPYAAQAAPGQGYSAAAQYAGDFYDLRRPDRRKDHQHSPNLGPIFALIGGGAIVGVAVIGLIIWMASSSLRSGGPAADAGDKSGNGTYRIEHLAANPGDQGKESLMNHKQVWLDAGKTISIRVVSDFNTDVDCFLDDPSGVQVAEDTSGSKDCHITYRVMQSGYHTIVVDNLGTTANRCTVTYNSSP